MELFLANFPLIFGGLVTAWGSWLTYQGLKQKGRQDSNQALFEGLQQEVARLREDLKERDAIAAANHHEILQLRAEVLHARTDIYTLKASLNTWITGAKALYRQVVDAGQTPTFEPAEVPLARDTYGGASHEGITTPSPDGEP